VVTDLNGMDMFLGYDWLIKHNPEIYWNTGTVRNRPATEPVALKVHNVKLSFDIWLVLYMYFILYC